MNTGTRVLLILFALAFLALQVISYMSSFSLHRERVAKLEKQIVQFETRGAYLDLKLDPSLELKKEESRFRAQTVNFILKVLFISGITVFVYTLIKRKTRPYSP